MIQRRIVLLLLSALLAMPTIIGAAQAPNPDAEMFEEAPGIQASVWRSYLHPDAEAAYSMTAEEAAILAPVGSDITVSSFDTSENAAAYFDVLADMPFDFELDFSQGIVSQEQANQTNDTQSLYRLRLGHGNERTQGFQQMVLQEDEVVFTVMFEWRAVYQDGMDGPNSASVPDVIEPLTAQIAAGQPSSAPVIFAADGSSTGGLWGYMPANGDPLLMGLVATEDISVFPPETDAAVAGTTPVEGLPGIQHAVLRDFVRTFSATPAIPDLAAIGVTVYQFDTPENARASYELLLANITAELTIQSSDPGNTLVTAAGSGLGERSHFVRLDSVHDQGYQSQEYLLTLHDTYVVAVMTVTGGPQTSAGTPVAITLSSAAAINLTSFLVTSGQPSTDAPVFTEDGTSTGGAWGFMPEPGDPLLQGLQPVMDQQLYPQDPSTS